MGINMQLMFTNSITVQCVEVPIVDDEEGEETEDFRALLMPDGTLPGGVVLNPDSATAFILDNEGIQCSS